MKVKSKIPPGNFWLMKLTPGKGLIISGLEPSTGINNSSSCTDRVAQIFIQSLQYWNFSSFLTGFELVVPIKSDQA